MSGERGNGQYGLNGQGTESIPSIKSIQSFYPGLSANAALVLIGVACALPDRQIAAPGAAFEEERGFTERLYRVRSARRRGAEFASPCRQRVKSNGARK